MVYKDTLDTFLFNDELSSFFLIMYIYKEKGVLFNHLNLILN